MIGELDERHELWGQPGKIKVTGYLERGSMGEYSDAVALAQGTGQPADINAVRSYRSRPGVSMNVEQQVNDKLGVFFRAGWADGHMEPWDFTDIDRYVQGGVSINGKSWGRPDDTIGVAGLVNGQRSRCIPKRRRPRHPGRRRTTAQLRHRENSRSLLQLRPDGVDPAHLRLSIRRQPRLQRRPRPCQYLCRPRALAVLTRPTSCSAI